MVYYVIFTAQAFYKSSTSIPEDYNFAFFCRKEQEKDTIFRNKQR